MKTPPTEPGLYLHIPVSRIDKTVGDSVYLLRVREGGRFWHPVHFTRSKLQGSFIRLPAEIQTQAEAEATEVFVEKKAEDILSLDPYYREKPLQALDAGLRGLVVARMKELDPKS